MKRKLLLLTFAFTLTLAGCYPYYEEDPISAGGDGDLLLKNGGFELTEDGVIPEFWTQSITGDPEFQYFSINSENIKEGENALKIAFFDGLANPDPVHGAWGGLYQKVITKNWDPNITNRLQYWYKTDIGNFQIRILKNGSFNNLVLNQMAGPTNTWLFSEIPFDIDYDTEFIEVWITTKTANANNGLVRAWIDGMKILR